MKLAHEWSESSRTVDVTVSGDVTFSGMMLSDEVLQGLTEAGFRKPSPVQLQAIPIGRCGFDLIVEAKSGTGKTAVFGIISLEMIKIQPNVQVLILAPTREIAVQVCEVIRTIGSAINGLHVETVMGGTSCQDDIRRFSKNSIPQIVVGSPGRLRHLVQQNVIDTSAVRLLVLDEADKLMEGSFQADINYIHSKLDKKQVIAASATYSEQLRTFISRYMKSPSHIRPDNSCILLGVSQSITLVKRHDNLLKQIDIKYAELKDIISSVNFKQCLVFCNYQARSKKICTMLKRDGWPAEYLSGCQTQDERLRGLRSLQEFKCRVLVATDLAARGLDASNVDLILNFEPPYEVATYLHRIGRAGRYGSYGSAITILSRGTEEAEFKAQIKNIGHSIQLTDFRTKSGVVLDEKQVDLQSEASSSEHAQSSNNIVLDPEDKMELDFEKLLDSFNNTKSTPDTVHVKNTKFPTFKQDKCDTINLNKLSANIESLFNSHTQDILQDSNIFQENNPDMDVAELRKADATSIDTLGARVKYSFSSCTETLEIVENNHVAEVEIQENNRKITPNCNGSKKVDLVHTAEKGNRLHINISSDTEMTDSLHKERYKPKRGTRRNKKMYVSGKSKYSFHEHLNTKEIDKNSNIDELNGESLVNKSCSSKPKNKDSNNIFEEGNFDVCENYTDGIMEYNKNAPYFANRVHTSDSEHEEPVKVGDRHKKMRNKPAGQRQRSSNSTNQYWDKIEEMTTSVANMDYDAWRAQLAVMSAQIEQSVYISELCNPNI